MPLNPPSYIGHDVWYSPDVYVNRVPVALWQPAQARGIPAAVNAAMTAYTQGESIAFDPDPTQRALQLQAYTQQLIRSGVITKKEADAAASITPDASTPATNKQNPNVNTDTGGVENRSEWPSTLPLSRHYTLGELTQYPGILLASEQWWVTKQMWKNGNGPLKPGEIVANLKLLAVNVLDPILDKWPGMRITNTVRPSVGKDDLSRFPNKQHPRGQAADIQLPNNWNKHYDMAKWIQDNTPFDQLIIERNSAGTWVHVSYANPPILKPGNPYKVFCLNLVTGKEYLNGLYNI